MTQNTSLHILKFSEKVTHMNQTHSKSLTMTQDEARNLQSEILALLARAVELSEPSPKSQPDILVEMNGGKF